MGKKKRNKKIKLRLEEKFDILLRLDEKEESELYCWISSC